MTGRTVAGCIAVLGVLALVGGTVVYGAITGDWGALIGLAFALAAFGTAAAAGLYLWARLGVRWDRDAPR